MDSFFWSVNAFHFFGKSNRHLIPINSPSNPRELSDALALMHIQVSSPRTLESAQCSMEQILGGQEIRQRHCSLWCSGDAVDHDWAM
jgi:hypothetical protein